MKFMEACSRHRATKSIRMFEEQLEVDLGCNYWRFFMGPVDKLTSAWYTLFHSATDDRS